MYQLLSAHCWLTRNGREKKVDFCKVIQATQTSTDTAAISRGLLFTDVEQQESMLLFFFFSPPLL